VEFDADGNSLGATIATDLGNGDRSGGTDEDRLFGMIYSGGISMIRIHDNDDGPIEVDHLQFGRLLDPPPAQSVRFSLGPGAPDGASIDPQTGVFTWTTNEIHGPSNHSVTVRATDDGSPSVSTSRTLTITVNEINEPPVLDQILNETVTQGQTLHFNARAADPDQPASSLEFSLDARR
jgi:hypothetical protein